MARTATALIAIGFLGTAGVHTHAKGVVMQRNLSLALARTIADATLAECQAKGFHTSVAVVDRSGQPLVLLRDVLLVASLAVLLAAFGERTRVSSTDTR